MDWCENQGGEIKMNGKTWDALGYRHEKSLKNMVAPCDKELFHLELTAYSTVLGAGILTAVFEEVEHNKYMDKILEKYEDDYVKLLKRIEELE